MSASRNDARQTVGAAVAAVTLVVAIGLLTNSLDRDRFSWDYRYYIAIAEHGFGAPMASPFAYRYATPLLARGVSTLMHIPIEAGFTTLAYFGGIAQLLAVFLFARWYTRSSRGAWFAMLITAFSLFNVKFLLFDPFRPDHLAFSLILLQSYFALTGRFLPLLVSTMIGCQIREFNAIPLVAYLYASWRVLGDATTIERRRETNAQTLLSAVGLGIALAIPRLLIPVAEDFQFVSLSRDGLLRGLVAPLVLARDVNFIYSLVAYLLPVLMLGGPRDVGTVFGGMARRYRSFLYAYGALVLALSFFGGTDFYRFSAYLIVIQGILLGALADKRSYVELAGVLFLVFVFNRIWMAFPMSDVGAYLDFYGGSGTRFNWASVLRLAECGAYVAVGRIFSRIVLAQDSRPPAAAR